MPFLDQNVFLFSVRKDSHIVKALIFVTEAVPYCFHWFPQSEVAVCKQKAEIWTALNNNKYNGVKRISRLEKVYFWVLKIKLKKESNILIETSNVWRLQRSTARGNLTPHNCCVVAKLTCGHINWEFQLTFPWPVSMGFPGGSDGKGSACNAGDPGSIPGLGSSPGARECYSL